MEINQHAQEALRIYQYKGQSSSFLNYYLISPLCNKIVQLIPKYISPNFLTLIGLICVVLGDLYLLFYNYGKKITEFECIIMGLMVMLYQIIDNCDGKQARRTGNSTPLGIMFDHGVDSFILNLLLIVISKIIDVLDEERWIIWIWWYIISVIPFFVAQWRFYHVGALNHKQINLVDEGKLWLIGNFFLQMIIFTTGIFGTQIWNYQLFGLKMKYYFMIGTIIGSIYQSIDIYIETYKETRMGLWNFLSDQFCIILMGCVYASIYFFHPQLIQQNLSMILVQFSLNFIWSVNEFRLIISRMCQIYNKFINLPFFLISVYYILTSIVIGVWDVKINPYFIGGVGFIFSSVILLHFCVTMCFKIASILQINILRINQKPYKPKKRKQ